MRDKALRTVENYNMLDGAERVVVGLSGGADSVALLHFLISQRERYGFEVRAAHVNHLLRGDESERDELFVRSLCDALGVVLDVLRVDVDTEAKKRRVGQEECGRQVRYEFFCSLCATGTLIATAHTLSDSLETVLLNITRGTGIHGLCGISAVRGNIIRPLIECTRQEIEQYCFENSLDYVNDSTNYERDYNRNIVRLDVVPRLLEINPSLYKVALRMIRNNTADDEYLRSVASETVEASRRSDGFSTRVLLSAQTPIRLRAISMITNEACGVILEDVHCAAVDRLVSNGCGAVDIPQKNVCAVRDGRLIFNPADEQEIPFFRCELELGETNTPVGVANVSLLTAEELKKINVKQKKRVNNALDYDMIKGKLFFRNRIAGDEICISGRKCTKTLKKLFNEDKIPTSERSRILLLCDDEGIVWMQGYGVAERVSVSETTSNALIISFAEL